MRPSSNPKRVDENDDDDGDDDDGWPMICVGGIVVGLFLILLLDCCYPIDADDDVDYNESNHPSIQIWGRGSKR
jgi:hypothetical protein